MRAVRRMLRGVVLRIVITLAVMAPIVLAQEVPRDPADLLRRTSWPSDQYTPEGNPRTQPPRTGPEFRPRSSRFKMSQFARHWYRYAEAPDDPELALFGIEPIDVINQKLFGQGYKCIADWQLVLPALQQVDRGIRHFGDKTYVIKCEGDCDDVFYTASARGYRQVTISGLAFPFPMFEIANGFGYANAGISIQNRSQVPGQKVSIHIYQWTRDAGDYGGGCQIR